MSGSTFGFAMTRPRVLIPGILGCCFLSVWGVWWLGVGFLAVALMRIGRILSHTDLDDRLRLKSERQRHGLRQRLSDAERVEVLAIDNYGKELTGGGADEKLAEEISERMWRLIRERRPHDASGVLADFRRSLPELPMQVHGTTGRSAASTPGSGEDLSRRIEHELDLMRAARIEVEAAAI